MPLVIIMNLTVTALILFLIRNVMNPIKTQLPISFGTDIADEQNKSMCPREIFMTPLTVVRGNQLHHNMAQEAAEGK